MSFKTKGVMPWPVTCEERQRKNESKRGRISYSRPGDFFCNQNMSKREVCMKQTLALAVGAAVFIGMTYGALSLRASERVKVCHVTGNGRAHVIEIDEHAVPAHLAHGDSLEAAEGLEHGDSCEVLIEK